MALTEAQLNDLQIGDLVTYVSGTDERNHIEAEGEVVDVDDKDRVVVIRLIEVKEHGDLVDHSRHDTISVNADDLTIVG